MNEELKYASLRRRLIGGFIDRVIILLLMLAELYLYLAKICFLLPDELWVNFLVFLPPFLLTPFAYCFLLEYFFSQTVGKMICRTKVVNEDGSKPSAAVICRRTLWRIKVGGPITSLWLFSYVDENDHFTRMNHDVHSHTLVIQK